MEKQAILVIAGTSDAVLLVERFLKKSIRVVATVVSEAGQLSLLNHVDQSDQRNLKVIQGRFDVHDFMQLIHSEQIGHVVDASHPYATQVTPTIERAAQQAEVPFDRFDRPSGSVVSDDGLYRVSDAWSAAQLARRLCSSLDEKQTIFLTTGSKDLHIYADQLPINRLVARVLPVVASIEMCTAVGLLPKQIIAMQGPFDVQMNQALFQTVRAGLVLTKYSGDRGGFREKVLAAQALKIPVIVIERPQILLDQKVIWHDMDPLVEHVLKTFNRSV